MKKLKLPHELSLEDLLNAASTGEETTEEAISPVSDPYLSFIQAFKILPGTQPISAIQLHKLFKLWFKGKPPDKRTFKYEFGKYFVPRRFGKRLVYYLSHNVQQLINLIGEEELNTRPPSKSKSKVWNNHFNKFLADTGLAPGSLYVEVDIIFYVYNRWCDKSRKSRKLGTHNFVDICRLHFESKQFSDTGMVLSFGLNNKFKQLITKEEIRRWREGRKKYGKKRSKTAKLRFNTKEEDET